MTAVDLEQISGIKEIKEKAGRFEITLSDPSVGKEVLKQAQTKGDFQEFSQQPLSLDEIFKIKAREV